MRKSKFLVRFVDIVLILLFGFISISRIAETSQIELPESERAALTKPDQEVSVFIGVTAEGTYLVEGESRVIQSESGLQNYLMSLKQRFGDLPFRVRIRSDHDAPIGHAVSAARMCDTLGIVKSLDVELTSVTR